MIWFVCLVADWGFTALAMLLAPVLPLFASADGWLPRWLWWFQTPDNPLDGDEGWRREHWQWRYQWRCHRYIGRVGWLWRNPSYGFGINAIGFRAHSDAIMRVWGQPRARDAVAGWYFKRLVNPSGVGGWQLFVVWNWSASRLFRLNLGWKLWTWENGRIEGSGSYQFCQFVCTLKPWKAR